MTSGLSDFHSHIFPGVDDGSTCVEDSLEGVGRMVAAGVSRIITTPHIQASAISNPESFAETMMDMDEAWSEVQPEILNAFSDLDFRRGHEVMLDVPHPDLSDPRLHLGGTNFVLVEWPQRAESALPERGLRIRIELLSSRGMGPESGSAGGEIGPFDAPSEARRIRIQALDERSAQMLEHLMIAGEGLSESAPEDRGVRA